MKKTIFLLIVLASFTVYAQEAKTGSKFSIGFNFSPDYSFRTIKNNGSGLDPAFTNWDSLQIGKLGYTTGLNISYKLTNIVVFETGLQYSNKGYRTKEMELFFDPFPEPTDPSLLTKAKFHYSYQYIGIPLKMTVLFGDGHLRFISGFGVTTNFLLNVKTRTDYEHPDGKKETKKNKTTEGFNKIDISPMINIGVDYQINNSIHLRAEPTFRYGIIKTSSAPPSEYLWNAGLNLGLSYQL